MTLIAKQAYIGPQEVSILHVCATASNGTEAEVVRDAIDAVQEPEDPVTENLRRRGLLLERPPTSKLTQRERDELQRWLDESVHRRGGNPRLSEAILEDRAEADARV